MQWHCRRRGEGKRAIDARGKIIPDYRIIGNLEWEHPGFLCAPSASLWVRTYSRPLNYHCRNLYSERVAPFFCSLRVLRRKSIVSQHFQYIKSKGFNPFVPSEILLCNSCILVRAKMSPIDVPTGLVNERKTSIFFDWCIFSLCFVTKFHQKIMISNNKIQNSFFKI